MTLPSSSPALTSQGPWTTRRARWAAQGEPQCEVDLSPELVEALRRWKAKQAERALKEGRGEVPRRIFPMPSPKSGADLVWVAFKRVLKKARLPRYSSPHCARHTYASILLSEDGGPRLYVQERRRPSSRTGPRSTWTASPCT